MGVVVRRYIDILTIIINFSTPLVLALSLAAASLLLCSFFKHFFVLYNTSGVGISNYEDIYIHVPPYNNTH